MKHHSLTEALVRFLNGKGFYIALVFSLAALMGSGWYLWQEYHTARQLAAQVSQVEAVTVDPGELEDEDEPEGDRSEAAAAAPVTLPERTEDAAEEEPEDEPEEPAEETEAAAAQAEVQEPTKTATEKATDAQEAEQPEAVETAAWVWPLEGQVVSAFSADSLNYNAALKDWRTHDGIDLSAKLGEPVVAAHGGTVTAVRDDVLLGKTVTMQLENGLSATYGNLNEEVSVAAGDVLATGDPVGTVGETAAGEHNDRPWLHFALTKDGEAVDPLAYLSPEP